MFEYLGVRIVPNPNLTVDGEPYELKRTLKERLLTLPWKPLVLTRIVTPQVPDKWPVQMGVNTWIVHPDLINEFKGFLRWREARHAK